MDEERDYPAEAIEPGWMVHIDGTWQTVWAAIETEPGGAPEEGNRVWLFLRGQPERPLWFHKGAAIRSRPPMSDEGRLDALGDSTNTDRYQVTERRLKDARGEDASLEQFIRDKRQQNVSWTEISFDLWREIGVRLDPETLRRWMIRADGEGTPE